MVRLANGINAVGEDVQVISIQLMAKQYAGMKTLTLVILSAVGLIHHQLLRMVSVGHGIRCIRCRSDPFRCPRGVVED